VAAPAPTELNMSARDVRTVRRIRSRAPARQDSNDLPQRFTSAGQLSVTATWTSPASATGS
jgi:hypothetical protein